MKSLPQLAAALCGLLAIGSSTAVAQTVATSYSWTSTGPIVSPKSDATHDIIAVKDPSAVYYNGQWIVYASDVNSAGDYNMEYLNIGSSWSNASSATPYFMDNTPGFSGYHTAPQVFYFAPQNKWYLIFQSGQPQYSTNSDPTKPQNWTQPQNFFASQPSSVSNWIDFWVICDSENCYLFFAGDNGNFYRSSTPIGNFPNGFNTPVIVYSSSEFDLFEADNVYSVEGTGAYLADVECLGPQGQRYFRALTATNLGGTWTALGNTNNFSTPFLGQDDVSFESGVSAWTTSFSSGGLLIDGDDQTDSVNPSNLVFLYQGANPTAYADDSYGMIPWQLGLATSNANSSGGTTQEAPYGGTAAAIPGTVMAENYDTGGQGVAYNVTSTNGTDNAYRSDGVDLETASSPATANDLGWTAAGQWFKYTVNVAMAGTYNVTFLVAGDTAITDAFHLSNSSGTNLTGAVAVPSTGGWQDWTTVTATATLPAGTQILTLNEDNSGWNIDSMVFASGSGVSCTTNPSAPTGLTATSQSSSGINLSWSAVTAPSNCTISAYKVFRSTTNGFAPSSSNQIASVSSGTAYSDTGLSASTTYYYVVEAVDAERKLVGVGPGQRGNRSEQ